ncbi:MAG: caspase family protein [Anaerolineae bacterium]|nr:caspase family protein [Anaerolineae bacterium]
MILSPYLSHYEHSYALVIGINAYKKLPPLQSAVHDAKAVAHTLAEKLGFEVTLLLDAKATRDAILSYVSSTFSDTHPDDRVLIYFAGHGITRRTTSGDNVGLLMPYGATPKQYHQAIEMDHLIDQSKFIPAKHILFILDACFSGLAMTRAGDTSGCLLQDLMTRRAVQAIAAGQEDQMVADFSGPGGHSIFTGLLLERLGQPGGLLTGNELGLYLQRQVGIHTKSRQTPHFGHLLGSQGGDFVFWAEEESKEPSSEPEQVQSRDAESAVTTKLRDWWQVGLLFLALVTSLVFSLLLKIEYDISYSVFIVSAIFLGVMILDYVTHRDWLPASLCGIGAILWLIVGIYDPLDMYDRGFETVDGVFLTAQIVTGLLLLWLIVRQFSARRQAE